jgi:hypothetical protein
MTNKEKVARQNALYHARLREAAQMRLIMAELDRAAEILQMMQEAESEFAREQIEYHNASSMLAFDCCDAESQLVVEEIDGNLYPHTSPVEEEWCVSSDLLD